MVNDFIRHIRSKNILDFKKPYLLAISGGMDSVCLGHLLKLAEIEFSLAHVNFQLRDSESEGDEEWVKKLAEKWNVPIFIKKTLLEEFKGDQQSIQMAAREFRYNWFIDLIQVKGFEGVLVAHHFEDQVETILLNLLRGTGIEGVYGMAEKRDNIIRPLLSFKRKEIEHFMVTNHFSWRNDSSNSKSEYKRNFIRNEVIPHLSEVFPDPNFSLDFSFQRLKDTGRAFFHLYEKWKKDTIQKEGVFSYLKIAEIERLPGKSSLVYYWLRDYGFNFNHVQSIISTLKSGESGKSFISGKYVLNLDREMLILGPDDFSFESREVLDTDIELQLKHEKYDILNLVRGVALDRSAINGMFDKDKLVFPLRIRKWEEGDKFVPLGMNKEKKISDLLIDLKVPLINKKTVTVLCSGNDIAWVIGYRISDRFKCDANTEKVLYFKNSVR